jgi:hypothetical protein
MVTAQCTGVAGQILPPGQQALPGARDASNGGSRAKALFGKQ